MKCVIKRDATNEYLTTGWCWAVGGRRPHYNKDIQKARVFSNPGAAKNCWINSGKLRNSYGMLEGHSIVFIELEIKEK